MKICMMQVTSHYVVMFFWTAACVRTQDPSALNSSSAEDISTNAASPLCLSIGDNPKPKCALESSTTTTPTVQQSPSSPEETKFSTKTPTQSPTIVDEMVHKNQEDGRNATESTNCTFDPCVHLQDTCFNTPDLTCICSGVTSTSQPPDSPTSLAVTVVTHSLVLVTWCAPNSPVTQYLLGVRYEGFLQKNLSFSSAARQVFISDLEADRTYHICLQAVNGAGSSGPECASVWMGLNTQVFFYTLLVVCGVLMLIVATLSFCLYKQCKKATVENPHLTRLISIPNPAFFNP